MIFFSFIEKRVPKLIEVNASLLIITFVSYCIEKNIFPKN